jgi:hypothetical protein
MMQTEHLLGTRQLLFYFGLMALLVNLVNPAILLDVPTSYMLKNIFHAPPSEISRFRLVTGIPIYLGFAFGMVRDLWNPFGLRDRGYFRVFVPVMVCALTWVALSRISYSGLLLGMLLTMIAYLFVSAAYQGLTALIAQEALMTGRLSTLANIFLFIPVSAAYFVSGLMSEHLSPRQIFLIVLALAAPLGIFGFWNPGSILNHAYDNPHAQGTNFFGDVRRLVHHRAIYPVVLINLLWYFSPGSYTPMQFFLTNELHAPDAVYGEFLGISYLTFLPSIFVYGWLCTKFPPRRLLWWSVIIGVPQFIPMLFIHTGEQALAAAVLIGLMGGMATAACVDIAMRACPPGLQGTMMMIIAASFALSSRGGDVVGSWLYALSPVHGFSYCVAAITVTYLLILPIIPFIPRRLIATADGEPNPAAEALVLEEIANAHQRP